MRRQTAFICALIVLALSVGHPRAQAPAQPLPPLSWTCPMHPEVVDNKAGACPICRMTLVPVRLALVWTCPVHSQISADAQGSCKLCGRPLVRVTKALSWTCPVHSKVDVLEPGKCPICRRTLRAKYTRRPHGDHNPKHGGNFFMAPNNWHLEGSHPARDVFRIYVYDEYSDPVIPPGFSARAIVRSSSPAGEGTPVETSVPFRRLPGRPYLEVRVPGLALPASVVIKVRFEASEPEYPFNFDFFDYSREPAPRRAASR
jgi:hypothetical protein